VSHPTIRPAPIVAPRVDSTRWYTSSSILQELHDIGQGVQNRNWVEVGVGVFGAAADVGGAILDPIGTLASLGAGWAIEHIRPLSDMLDWVSGDPDQVAAYGQTWRNVARATDGAAELYKGYVDADIRSWQDAAGSTYRSLVSARCQAMHELEASAEVISKITDALGTVVGIVRAGIKWLISFIIGKIISWVAEEAASLGLATPLVVTQAIAAIAQVVAKATKLIKDLLASLRKLKEAIEAYKLLVKAIKIGRPVLGVAGGLYNYKPYAD
jgi:hypothetical protein